MAFYRHVRAATNGFETNDVIEDSRHWLRSVARWRQWWGGVYYCHDPFKDQDWGISLCNLYHSNTDSIFKMVVISKPHRIQHLEQPPLYN